MHEHKGSTGVLFVGIGGYGEQVLTTLRDNGLDAEDLLQLQPDDFEKATGSDIPLKKRLDARAGIVAMLELEVDESGMMACQLALASEELPASAYFISPRVTDESPASALHRKALREVSGGLLLLDDGADPAGCASILASLLGPDQINAPLADILGPHVGDSIWRHHSVVSSGPDRSTVGARHLADSIARELDDRHGTIIITIAASDLRLSEMADATKYLVDSFDGQGTLLFGNATAAGAQGEIRISAMVGTTDDPGSSGGVDDAPGEEAMAVRPSGPLEASTISEPLVLPRSSDLVLPPRTGPQGWHPLLIPTEPFGTITPARAEVEPDTLSDDLDCTVYSQPRVRMGCSTIVEAWAHRPDQAEHVESLNRKMDPEAKRLGVSGLEDLVERGQRLSLELSSPGMRIDDPVRSFIWRGDPKRATFQLDVPDDFAGETIIGCLRVLCDGVPCGRVHFRIGVADRAGEVADREPASAASGRLKGTKAHSSHTQHPTATRFSSGSRCSRG